MSRFLALSASRRSGLRARVALGGALTSGLTTLALLFGASSASAVTACLPTDFTQDSHTLTAALINPPDSLVPENLDATGCDIGIYYNSGSHSLTGKHVFGSTYYGVLSNNEGTVTTFSGGSVYEVGEHPHNGTQHGIDIAWRNGADGGIDHSQIYDYQKGGVLAAGSGTNVSTQSNVVRGLGPVPFIAQNGVQYSSGATGAVNNNYIADNQYTGCTKQQQNAGQCTYVVSTGILLVAVAQNAVDTKNNTYRNNDVNLLNAANSP